MPSDIAQLVDAVAAARDAARAIRPAARLISVLENAPARLPELLQAIALTRARDAAPSAGPASSPGPRLLLGVTGAPGSGKSTLVDALVAEYRTRFPDRRVGVIAVDPSSPFTGGAVLGDRVRMMRHATDPNVFVRSMASRGHLGGLTLGVKGAVHVMALMGCDVVFLETVGVGQSEVEVAGVADMVLLVLAPGQGDSIQLLKAGLMEIGDVFVVNKADKPDAAALHAQILAALQLDARIHAGEVDPLGAPAHCGGPGGSGEEPGGELLFERGRRGRIRPRTCLVSAHDKAGVPALVDLVEALDAEHGSAWRARRSAAVGGEIRDAILEEARRRVELALGHNHHAAGRVRRVLEGDVSVGQVVDELLDQLGRAGPTPPAPKPPA